MFSSFFRINKELSEKQDTLENYHQEISKLDKKLKIISGQLVTCIDDDKRDTVKQLIKQIEFSFANRMSIVYIDPTPLISLYTLDKTPHSEETINELLTRRLSILTELKDDIIQSDLSNYNFDKTEAYYAEVELWKFFLFEVRQISEVLMSEFSKYESTVGYRFSKILFNVLTADEFGSNLAAKLGEYTRQITKSYAHPIDIAIDQAGENNEMSLGAGVSKIGLLRRREITEAGQQKFNEPVISNIDDQEFDKPDVPSFKKVS